MPAENVNLSSFLRRAAYLGYYARKMDWHTLGRFMRHTRHVNDMSGVRQVAGFLVDSFRYNVSPLEWYQFGFPALEPDEKSAWAGTGTMYEFQLKTNPPETRGLLLDKRRFYSGYRQFFRHSLWSIGELADDQELTKGILAEHDRLVFKNATGNCGASVRIVPAGELEAPGLTEWMRNNGFDIVETFVDQHSDLQALSPSGVNTVRIFTLVDDRGAYRTLGCRLRISVDSHIDNLAAGNLAAPIDDATGRVKGPGVYSDITRSPETVHPVTRTPIESFQVPFWQETLDMVKAASLLHPENRSIGWDVVVTPGGPGLIEGNHDWCKLVWQLPVGRGLKSMLYEAC